MLMPLLMMGKMKMTMLIIAGYIVVAVIAKKALLLGILSILLSGIASLKKTFWHEDGGHGHGYSAPDSYEFARKIEETDHSLVYSAYQPKSR